MGARATVIIPTYGEAPFALWAVQSVREQTLRDMEICIICDGSPPESVTFFREMARQDSRIRVFAYPKSPRTGEPYRDEVIRQTTGKIICYCAHDDLWLPWHAEAMEESLKTRGFTHSIHTQANTGNGFDQHLFDFCDDAAVEQLLFAANYFGLSFAAHTRAYYLSLPEGWVTTPDPDIPTDQYMWRKFVRHDRSACGTVRKVTVLAFPKPNRAHWSAERRAEELREYYAKMQSPVFLKKMEGLLLESYVNDHIRRDAELREYVRDRERLQACIASQEGQLTYLTGMIRSSVLMRLVCAHKEGKLAARIRESLTKIWRR